MNIMKQIEQKQFNQFKYTIDSHETMSKRFYTVVYLATFLGPYFPKNIMEMEDNEFKECCHNIIDGVSLCAPEIDFFHKMVDHGVEDKTKYVDELIEIYKQTEDLERCQLGPNMLKCLEASKNIKFE